MWIDFALEEYGTEKGCIGETVKSGCEREGNRET